MIPWLKSYLYDEAKFAALVRMLIFLAGELPTVIDFGSLGGPAYWVGKVLQAMALLVRSGDRTPPLQAAIASLSEEQQRMVASLLERLREKAPDGTGKVAS